MDSCQRRCCPMGSAISGCAGCAAARRKSAAKSRFKVLPARARRSASSCTERRPTHMQALAKPTKIRIMLVDDHIVMRMGLVTATSGESDMEVVAEADNGLEAMHAYRAHRPDVVVLDLRMPKQNG